MSSSVKDIKRKIKSINSTKQITKAMELVATSKMKKAVDSAVNLRAYGYLGLQLLSQMSEKYQKLHPYFEKREVKNVLLIFFTTDKGLCGGLNANLFKKMLDTLNVLEKEHKDAKIHFACSGKKGAEFLKRIGKEVDFLFPAFTNNPTFSNILPLSSIALSGFTEGEYDLVELIYPDFISTLIQKPTGRVLLPFSVEAFKQMLDELGAKMEKHVVFEDKNLEYKLEPSPKYILENIVLQLTETQLFQAVRETSASEHSARMVAMQNATTAASDLIDDLVLTYNQARQAVITAEIAEIASVANLNQ